MKTAYVITWSHHDKSGFGVVAIRDTKEEAEELIKLLQGNADLKFESHEADTEKV
jgi:hypothetical protein